MFTFINYIILVLVYRLEEVYYVLSYDLVRYLNCGGKKGGTAVVNLSSFVPFAGFSYSSHPSNRYSVYTQHTPYILEFNDNRVDPSSLLSCKTVSFFTLPVVSFLSFPRANCISCIEDLYSVGYMFKRQGWARMDGWMDTSS
jgi:hypothetical protein